MLVRSTLRLKLGAQLRALDSGAECPLALRPISVAFFLGALEAFGSAFGVRGNRVQLANNVLSRNVALNQERILASRSIIYSLRLLQVRYEQAVGHALLKVPDHRRLACRDRDCQRLARSRSELDDIGPIALRAEDHDPVVASHYRRLVLCYSSSASRFTAGASDDVAEVRSLGFPGAWVKHSPPKRLRNASAVAVSRKAESNIDLLDLVLTPAAADWDASFAVKCINF